MAVAAAKAEVLALGLRQPPQFSSSPCSISGPNASSSKFYLLENEHSRLTLPMPVIQANASSSNLHSRFPRTTLKARQQRVQDQHHGNLAVLCVYLVQLSPCLSLTHPILLSRSRRPSRAWDMDELSHFAPAKSTTDSTYVQGRNRTAVRGQPPFSQQETS